MSSKITQRDLILQYLKDFESITPLEAYNDLGITKLATRVSEMRKDGIEIDGEMVAVKNRRGNICHVMRYTLGGEK